MPGSGAKMPSRGYVDGFIEDQMYGWCAAGDEARIALRIDGRTLMHAQTAIPRADVKNALGLETDLVGFQVFIPSDLRDGATHTVEIVAIFNDKIEIVEKTTLAFPKADSVSPQRKDSDAAAGLRRAAVVCWDLAHNPAGRALVLYDILREEYDRVDLVGPMFSRFGTDLWAPLRDLGLNTVSQVVNTYQDLVQFCEKASETTYGLVWICKPRLPSIMIGLAIMEKSGCRAVLDIDDYEMSFFHKKHDAAMKKNVLESLKANQIHPADFDATAYAHSFISKFQIRTVSNVSLQRSFGGEIIPHGRSAEIFDRTKFNVSQERAQLGISGETKIVAFVGTVRKHKGVLEIAQAIGMLERHDVVLLVAGTYENEQIKREILELTRGRAVIVGSVPFDRLPNILSAADMICLPQDMSSETSAYQLPAKLIDGLALGLRVLVNDLPTYDDLRIHPGLFIRQADETIEQAIIRTLDAEVDTRRARELFVAGLSVESLALRATSLFNLYSPSDCVASIDDVFEAIHGRPMHASEITFVTQTADRRSRDLVVLWKQIDSGLFGRRVDMVAKHMMLSGRFDRVFIIDAPITVWDYKQLQSRSISPGLSNARLLHDRFTQKFFGDQSGDGIFWKSFITSETGERVLGRILPTAKNLHREIGAYLKQVGISPTAELLVYPIANHLPDTLKAAKFARVVVDLVDDERDFTSNEQVRNLKHVAYIDALCAADIIMTNNDNMRDRFRQLSPREIHVVPNGVERFDGQDVLRPSKIAPDRPILGYIGNLRDRVDPGLIIAVADRFPMADILLVGPTGGNKDIERLRFHPNITMTGAMTYQDSRRVAASFTIGLIPHIQSSLTESMNPLKMYLYDELNIPVVSTPVGNLGAESAYLHQSDGSVENFLELVETALALGRPAASLWRRRDRKHLWSTRVRSISNFWN